MDRIYPIGFITNIFNMNIEIHIITKCNTQIFKTRLDL